MCLVKLSASFPEDAEHETANGLKREQGSAVRGVRLLHVERHWQGGVMSTFSNWRLLFDTDGQLLNKGQSKMNGRRHKGFTRTSRSAS